MKGFRYFVVFASLAMIMACSQPKQLQYQGVERFRIESLDLKKPEIGMDIRFYNPNGYSLVLKDASIDVYINERLIGNAAMNSSFTVPALDTFLMPVTLSADLSNVFPNALQLVFNKQVDVRLHGSVKAGRGILINIPIEYKGRHRLNIL